MTKKERLRFWILVSMISISGFSQGMILPLISIIFEKDGIHSSLNGLNATALYIGVLLASPLMEVPLKKFGYKPLILFGGLSVTLSLFLFSTWKSFWFWFFLRLFIGIGDHMLNFTTQTWITYFSKKENLGRNFSLYGLFFSLGFAIGPFMTRLLEINEKLPFIVTSLISLCIWCTILTLKNEFPEGDSDGASFISTIKRFGKVWKYAWVGLLPPLAYGFMETTLNSSFPIYAIRNGLDIDAVAMIIPAFSIGSIVFQLPLGILSDRYGRRNILIAVLLVGSICFIAAALCKGLAIGLFICFFLAGMAVGSTFSLGISFTSDLLPKSLLPAGNIMCGILFSCGSMIGPFVCGIIIDSVKGSSFFYLISFVLFSITISLFSFKNNVTVAKTL